MGGPIDPVDELLARYALLTEAASLTQEELERRMVNHAWHKKWEELVTLLSLSADRVSRSTVAECFLLAIRSAPLETVSALLERFPNEEFTECSTYEVTWSPTGAAHRRSKWEVSIQGTMVMHAVANHRPDVLLRLLEQGHDANCASARATTAVLQDISDHVLSYGKQYIPFQAYTARPENYVQLRRWDEAPDESPSVNWEGATPLALAVLLGYADCARILTEHGAWLEEAPSVSSAMNLFWRVGDADYEAARNAVLSAKGSAPHRPALWALAPTCSPEQLQAALAEHSYSREELAHAAYEILLAFPKQQVLWEARHRAVQTLCLKLRHIGQLCPDALCAPNVVGRLLAQCCAVEELQLNPFLPFLEGKVLDLSCLRYELSWLSYPVGKQLMETLARHCTLTMERDAVSPGLKPKILRLLIKYVTFLPPAADCGVSGLTLALLNSGDHKLVRHALETGLIWPGESVEELLLCQKHYQFSPTNRMAILSARRPAAERADRPFFQGCRWFADKMGSHSMPILTEERWQKWLYPSLQHSFGFHEATAAGEIWQVHSVLLAACLEGRKDIVEAWLRRTSKEDLLNTSSLDCAARGIHLVVTPLCAAALGGHMEIVRLLLEHGAPAQEHLWGTPSSWSNSRPSAERLYLPFSPVLAALLGGHRDIAALLCDRGALCCQNDPHVRYILTFFSNQQ